MPENRPRMEWGMVDGARYSVQVSCGELLEGLAAVV